ncbi:hypothetical protein EVAR_48558_1 [Eumeta japonica]|uniref:Uncharacterized protein n=1 Tax=Eumeta variegata TaxID=151549 RepID=A0A4C1YAV5_EUMVA|nr:hypothetical protein EVAR_48558_1 [Eumeta japonica]
MYIVLQYLLRRFLHRRVSTHLRTDFFLNDLGERVSCGVGRNDGQREHSTSIFSTSFTCDGRSTTAMDALLFFFVVDGERGQQPVMDSSCAQPYRLCPTRTD